MANQSLNPPTVVKGPFTREQAAEAPDGRDVHLLKGISVFPGVVTGPARVILRADDHQQVLPGEVLVAPFTDPAWTPYFLTAAAVVIEQGGILSHGSIVAREYGLPAVTNVRGAIALIENGDLIRVDGAGGVVTIVEKRR